MGRTDQPTIEELTAAIEVGDCGALYLVTGDRVLAEPSAVQLGEALAGRSGGAPEIRRRPPELAPILADLKTYSLFDPVKVVVVIDSAVLADSGAAGKLIEEALEVAPAEIDETVSLSDKERRAAGRLLQTLRLFEIDPESGSAEEVIAQLPDTVLAGGSPRGGRRTRRGKRQIEEARQRLSGLLVMARTTQLRGWADTDLGELADIVERGLPEGHALVMAESAVAMDHPLVRALADRGHLLPVGRVQAARRGGWEGLDRLVAEMRRSTGVEIKPPALAELARRTIHTGDARRDAGAQADSTARFAAEYRKLATIARDGSIDVSLVEEIVEDRGEEDAWKILDAIGEGRPGEAMQRTVRLVGTAEDPVTARLSFFSLLAGYCRQLVAVTDLLRLRGLPRRRIAYNAFKTGVAPQIQADLDDGTENPLRSLHPFRLYRIYSTACRLEPEQIDRLPAKVLESELRLKGDSTRPDVVLSGLVCELACLAAITSPSKR